MKTAIILAAGKGTKMWPYATVRAKAMLPVSNRPLVSHQVEILRQLGTEKIILAAHPNIEQFRNLFRNQDDVIILDVGETKGTAETFLKAVQGISEESVIVLYGDVYVDKEDLHRLTAIKGIGALVTPHRDNSRNHIGCTLKDHHISQIKGHSREGTSHHFLAFNFSVNLSSYMYNSSNLFPGLEVGMMVPDERFLESALYNMIEDGIPVMALETKHFCLDLDKPWHLMEANYHHNQRLCSSLHSHLLNEGSEIDDTASINGAVRLGKNSRIGKNVIIEGNVWVGENSTITAGAILKGDNVIGDNCEIGYYCFIDKGSTVGNNCKVLHGAELSGIIFSGVYLYHYMEITGIVGQNTDIGAGTVCGSLRFDDSPGRQKIKGRWEFPEKPHLGNACFIGDFCRTGINAILLPGIKSGARSIVGPGVILSEDLEENKAVFVKQEQLKRDWGPNKYGW